MRYYNFFGVLVECKSLLFGGFIEEKTEEKKELRMIGASIHAGEKIEIYEDTLITGKNQSRGHCSSVC